MTIKDLQKEIKLLLDAEKRLWENMQFSSDDFNDKNMFATAYSAVEDIELEINKLFKEYHEIHPNE